MPQTKPVRPANAQADAERAAEGTFNDRYASWEQAGRPAHEWRPLVPGAISCWQCGHIEDSAHHQGPARTVILCLSRDAFLAIRDGLETLKPDGDAIEIVDRTASLVSATWDAGGKEGGITTADLAALETSARAGVPGAGTLAAKVKAAQAGKPALWRDHLITAHT